MLYAGGGHLSRYFPLLILDAICGEGNHLSSYFPLLVWDAMARPSRSYRAFGKKKSRESFPPRSVILCWVGEGSIGSRPTTRVGTLFLHEWEVGNRLLPRPARFSPDTAGQSYGSVVSDVSNFEGFSTDKKNIIKKISSKIDKNAGNYKKYFILPINNHPLNFWKSHIFFKFQKGDSSCSFWKKENAYMKKILKSTKFHQNLTKNKENFSKIWTKKRIIL